MNLHGIVSGLIGAVNPHVPATLLVSTGFTVDDDGKRIPTYAAPVTVTAQVQALTFRDIMQVDGLNLQGTRRAIYLYGEVDGLVRVSQRGGDLITLADGPNVGVWLVAQVLEQWPDWCKVAATLQNGA
jgi:hypothetical protein